LRTSELFDESYRTVIDPEIQRVTLFCLDPSKRLAQTLKGLRSSVFFSATLTPIDYFAEVLGGSVKDRKERYASPFDPGQMKLRIAPLDVSFQGRDQSLDAVAETVRDHVTQAPGNHLIFCPSLSYLEKLHGKLTALGIICHPQKPSMNESERAEFLGKFTSGETSIGLAVMGGIFAEGIDLPGNQLIGVAVIGVGLPGLSLERDLLMAYYNREDRSGFDYAYRYPGMQRVLQAVGRLIRSEEDQGVALLVDRRFLETRYEQLFPLWWAT
jgi:Rad3-related DNA helicase